MTELNDWKTGYTRTELGEIFHVTRATYLEFDAGSAAERDITVGFDAARSVQLASDQRDFAVTEDDVDPAVVDVTLAGDGGPLRSSSMTVFALALSTALMQNGRTPLLPILFLLGGEQAIHTAVDDRLRHQLRSALLKAYRFPVASNRGGVVTARTAPLRLPYFLRLGGYFAMISHFLNHTGGGDQSRCPYSWPCEPEEFLSPAVHVSNLRSDNDSQTCCRSTASWRCGCWRAGEC